jgi:phytoene dehydrogenase-like protein
MAHFGALAALPAQTLANWWLRDARARAVFAGLAAHSALPLEYAGSAAFGLVMAAAAPAVGWPLVRGGSQSIINALAAHFCALGGQVHTGQSVHSLDELPPARAVLLDVTPRQLVRLAEGRLPERYVKRMERFHYGIGVCKLDWALSAPIPWKAAACAHAGTVHVGGTLEEIATAERMAWQGKHAERPFVFVAQQSLFDPTRAPAGKHTAWAYRHVPLGSPRDMTAEIEAQIERFAPRFRDCILARHVRTAAQMSDYNPNYVGGDILGGAQTLRQMIARPTLGPHPYATPVPGLYLCSSSTPPGGGVHGMCGYHAAKTVLNDDSHT